MPLISGKSSLFCLAQFFAVGALFMPGIGLAQANNPTGEKLYLKHCAQCHGLKGDAVAPSAKYFKPAPRDFTRGKYKIRSTATGELPTDSDIARAIRQGLAFHVGVGAYTVMPPWPRFSEDEVNSLVQFLKTFSANFSNPDYNNPKKVELPAAPSYSQESAQKGRKVFENNECIKCHGTEGRGDGASAPTLKDDWGVHIRPANLSKRWTFRGGPTREDIFRTVSTGLNGTPMPAYDSLTVEERWDLVNYVYSLSRGDEPGYNRPDSPVIAKPTAGTIDIGDLSKAKELFAQSPIAVIPISGQVIEPGREFFPSVDELQVRGVYNKDEIALLVSWHDMSAEKSGANSPTAEVQDGEIAALAQMPVVTKSEGDDPFAGEETNEDPFAEESVAAEPTSKYSDAVAVQFPAKAQEGFVLPYFIFGDSSNPVNLWFLDLAKQEPKLLEGKGSKSFGEKAGALKAIAQYERGEWTVVFKFPRSAEGSIQFAEKVFIPVAFSVWDGFNEERGNKRGLTSWYNLYLEPMEKPSAIAPMLLYGGGLFLLELIVIWWVRNRVQRSQH